MCLLKTPPLTTGWSAGRPSRWARQGGQGGKAGQEDTLSTGSGRCVCVTQQRKRERSRHADHPGPGAPLLHPTLCPLLGLHAVWTDVLLFKHWSVETVFLRVFKALKTAGYCSGWGLRVGTSRAGTLAKGREASTW